jgi:hypothetical protein
LSEQKKASQNEKRFADLSIAVRASRNFHLTYFSSSNCRVSDRGNVGSNGDDRLSGAPAIAARRNVSVRTN